MGRAGDVALRPRRDSFSKVDGDLDLLLVRNFAIALFIGALVGLEREKKKARAASGGIRTFILYAEAGAVSAWLAIQLESPWIFVATLLAVAAAVLAGYVLQASVTPEEHGLTTEMAAVAVCLLGGAAVAGHAGLAVALAIVTSAVLTFKEPIHGMVERIGREDLYAGLKLLIASFVVLPLLPNRTIDPWGAINPWKLWLLVILISAMSLVGYVAMRWLGTERGTVLTGLFGGLASSTAVTLAFARQSGRHGPDAGPVAALAGAILLAWTVMFGRVLVAVAVVNPGLLGALLLPLCAMGLACLAAAGWFLLRGSRRGPAQVSLRNPFELSAAIRFAAFFALILLAVQLARSYLPPQATYVVAALAGATEVDAITLSLAAQARDSIDPRTAVAAIVIASLANTLVKAGMVAVLGAAGLRRRILLALAAILVVGTASLLVGSRAAVLARELGHQLLLHPGLESGATDDAVPTEIGQLGHDLVRRDEGHSRVGGDHDLDFFVGDPARIRGHDLERRGQQLRPPQEILDLREIDVGVARQALEHVRVGVVLQDRAFRGARTRCERQPMGRRDLGQSGADLSHRRVGVDSREGGRGHAFDHARDEQVDRVSLLGRESLEVHPEADPPRFLVLVHVHHPACDPDRAIAGRRGEGQLEVRGRRDRNPALEQDAAAAEVVGLAGQVLPLHVHHGGKGGQKPRFPAPGGQVILADELGHLKGSYRVFHLGGQV